MTLTIKKQEDRETVATILFRNGYTVRQKKYKPAGAKKAETILEVLNGYDGSAASGERVQVDPSAEDSR